MLAILVANRSENNDMHNQLHNRAYNMRAYTHTLVYVNVAITGSDVEVVPG